MATNSDSFRLAASANDTYFDTRPFASVVKHGCNAPPRRKIAGCFLYEDTNTFLYSRTNMGKSIFPVLCNGSPIFQIFISSS